MWHLWKERCRRRFEENYVVKDGQAQQLILSIRYWIMKLGACFKPSSRSSTAFDFIAKRLAIQAKNPPLKQPTLVYWTRPRDDFLALNTDGAASEGLAAGGGILRDKYGNHLLNFFSFYGDGSNNVAESRAILDGILTCKRQGFTKFIIY
ncbi:hypothetical protein FRX31_030568 [Thalictrum thalictroides]|uniref:RNase H type-1 domain-containing protein n=1 Tax=Thalictrum thalictroides TaxID=46969 RepID=A0A7J6V454_THATH|nr:hypothetical protein FRX31_030568 [Thalictrum thalictroides]